MAVLVSLADNQHPTCSWCLFGGGEP